LQQYWHFATASHRGVAVQNEVHAKVKRSPDWQRDACRTMANDEIRALGVRQERQQGKFVRKIPQLIGILWLCFLCASSAEAQRVRGELHIEVHDPQGAAVAPSGELVSEANQFLRTFVTGPDGHYVAQDLPFGVYRLSLRAEGFAPWINLVEIRSEVPVRASITLGVAPVTTQVQVNDSATLVDANRTGTIYSVGQQAIEENLAARPGRSLSDLVSDQPGWLYEGNGTLHPRGSEYDVQYVFDGLPMTQNRSPAFAPAFDADEVESMRVLTANFPAEYGRKLGGIIEVTTTKDAPRGFHGQFDAGGGSFSTVTGTATLSYSAGKNRFSVSGNGFHTDRYLDPPVLQNFTNRGNADGFSASYERDFSDRDRLRITVIHNALRSVVPNELVQQQALQRQDIANRETTGQIFFQHTISPSLFLNFSGSLRDASSTLTSNPSSTPVVVAQDRGYREGYVRGDLAGHRGNHDWKAGVDSIFSPVHEGAAIYDHGSITIRSGNADAVSVCGSPLRRGAFGLRAGPLASRQLERQRGAAVRSLWIRGAGIRVEPARGSFAVRPLLESARSCIVRPRIPDSGNGKPAAGELAGVRFRRVGGAAFAGATRARQLL